MVEILITNDNGDQQIAGHFFISGGKVVSSNESLDWILDSQCRIGTKTVTAEASPREWLAALPANYSGTRLRARTVK